MIGMLVGMAGLSAWGLYRFNQIYASLPDAPDTASMAEKGLTVKRNLETAYLIQYGDIFKATTVVCIIGAVLGLLISSRREHADIVVGADEPTPAAAQSSADT
jgi:hypothetical protein